MELRVAEQLCAMTKAYFMGALGAHRSMSSNRTDPFFRDSVVKF